MPPPPQFKNDAERQTYERARRRAQAEAGFFVHLMWYGISIGFLFIINLITTPFGDISGGYGPRWLGNWNREPFFGGVRLAMGSDRVFQPAVAREVQREVLQEKQ